MGLCIDKCITGSLMQKWAWSIYFCARFARNYDYGPLNLQHVPSLEPVSPSARKFKREKLKEGEDLDHVLDTYDVFWTCFSISGRYRPRTATANAVCDSMACGNDRRSECINHRSAD